MATIFDLSTNCYKLSDKQWVSRPDLDAEGPFFDIYPTEGVRRIRCINVLIEGIHISDLKHEMLIPTVCLDVIALVASSCGHTRGEIEATRCAGIHGARDDPERARGTSTTPPSAAHSARRAHAGISRQSSTATPAAWHQLSTTPRAGTPQWPHTGGETPQSLHIPRDARPTHLSSFRLLAMASPHCILAGSA